jgi:hypothetical protein
MTSLPSPARRLLAAALIATLAIATACDKRSDSTVAGDKT